MAAPMSKVANLSLNSTATIEDPNSPAHELWSSALKTLSAQPGYQRAIWGRQLKSPNNITLIVGTEDCDSNTNLEAFKVSIDFKFLLESLSSLLDTPPLIYHIQFSSEAYAVLSAPCTEVITIYHTEPKYLENVEKFAQRLENKSGGPTGIAWGSIVEEVEAKGTAKGKGTGRAAIMLVGWESVEAHKAFKENIVFKENAPLIKQGMGGVSMHHVKFETF